MGTDLQVVDDNLGFAKDRTISRLTEMQVGGPGFWPLAAPGFDLLKACCVAARVHGKIRWLAGGEAGGAVHLSTWRAAWVALDAHWSEAAAAAFNWPMVGPFSLAQASAHMLTTCHAPHSPNCPARHPLFRPQSEEYLRAHAKAHAPELLLALGELPRQ